MLARLLWFWRTDRLGPDILTTHPLLYFKGPAAWLCRRKFKAFGEGSELRPHASAICTRNISIGKDVFLHPGTMLFADGTETGFIVIEDHVAIGAGVHIYVNNHRFDDPETPIKHQGYYPSEPVIIRRGAWIGANAVLLPGVEIGRNAVVGAGAVVTCSVPAHSVAVGVPARVKRTIGHECRNEPKLEEVP
jgi:acetyltransferase-like isoleucine patch superfamily enzyme